MRGRGRAWRAVVQFLQFSLSMRSTEALARHAADAA
jgi:hypothetical protein